MKALNPRGSQLSAACEFSGELELATTLKIFLAKAEAGNEVEAQLVTQPGLRILEFPTRYFGTIAILSECDAAQDKTALMIERGYSFLLHANNSAELRISSAPDEISKSFAREILCQLQTILKADRDPLRRGKPSLRSLQTGFYLDQFFTQVRKSPNARALEDDKEVLSYSELDRRSARVAQRLREAGVQKGMFVGLLFTRPFDSVIAMLGVLRAGAAFVPLDTASPPARLIEMLRDANIEQVLTDGFAHAYLPQQLIPLNAGQADGSEAFADCPIEPDAPAYAFFTSGSSGVPKAAVVSHKSLAAYVESISKHLKLGENDRVLQMAAPGFDVVVEEVFPTLAAGACVVTRVRSNPSPDLNSLLDHLQITVVELTTAYWHRWVERLVLRGANPPPSLRLVIAGGAHVSARIFSEWTKFGIELLHVYGTTETTCTSSVFNLPDGLTKLHPLWRGLPIGKPLDFCCMFVAGEDGTPLPPLMIGEICIAGDGVGLGYLNRPELTREKFVHDHPAFKRGTPVYRTGDIGRRLPDGNFEFLGRRDSQVKIRGYRIELSEVESAFRSFADISDAVVFPVNESLGALISPASIDANTLRDFLRSRLPSFMIPAHIHAADELPLLANGKVDRHRSLELLNLAPSPLETNTGDLTGVIVSTFSEALGHSNFSFSDSFFEIGGDSLSLLQVATQLSHKLGQPVSDLDVYMNPSIERLTAFLQSNFAAVSVSN